MLKNDASEANDGLIVCYMLIPSRINRSAAHRKGSRKPLIGKVRMETILKGGREVFRTKSVMLNSLKLDGENGRICWEGQLVDGNFHFFCADKLVSSHYKDEGTPRPEDVVGD
ncbi:MAG: hypothetical protein ABF370_14125 [Verrucomicrobiales bacterium]